MALFSAEKKSGDDFPAISSGGRLWR